MTIENDIRMSRLNKTKEAATHANEELDWPNLNKYREENEKLSSTVNKDDRIVLIGDSIIDQYDTVKPLNKPIKESILATKYLKTDIYLGGVFAAAINLSQFNNNVSICTLMGNDKDIKKPLEQFKKKIKSKIFYENNKVTTRKRRFVENAYNKKISEDLSFSKINLENKNFFKLSIGKKKHFKIEIN